VEGPTATTNATQAYSPSIVAARVCGGSGGGGVRASARARDADNTGRARITIYLQHFLRVLAVAT